MNRFDWRDGTIGRVSRARRSMFGAVFLAVVLGACATVGKDSPDDVKRKAATQDATERWQLIIKGDPGAAYDQFMSKGSRQVITRGEFVDRMKATTFRGANVERAECSAEVCQLSVYITYDHKLMAGVRTTLRERWVIEDGRLWYVWSP